MSCRVSYGHVSWEAKAEFDSGRPYSWQVFLPLKCQQIKYFLLSCA